jgi:hypothetical protein
MPAATKHPALITQKRHLYPSGLRLDLIMSVPSNIELVSYVPFARRFRGLSLVDTSECRRLFKAIRANETPMLEDQHIARDRTSDRPLFRIQLK